MNTLLIQKVRILLNITNIILVTTSIVAMLVPFNKAHAQRNCGTVEYQRKLQQTTPGYETTEQFEEWLKQRITEKNKPQNLRLFSVKEPILQIPVVVHIVHNGEPYGIGSNIPDEQILSQIETLNEDFESLSFFNITSSIFNTFSLGTS